MSLILIQFVLYFSIPLQENWSPYYENEQIKIEYTSSICGSKKLDLSFEYYLIRIINKADETLVINFHKGVQKTKMKNIKLLLFLSLMR